jgi:hypothetical protein
MSAAVVMTISHLGENIYSKAKRWSQRWLALNVIPAVRTSANIGANQHPFQQSFVHVGLPENAYSYATAIDRVQTEIRDQDKNRRVRANIVPMNGSGTFSRSSPPGCHSPVAANDPLSASLFRIVRRRVSAA